MNTVRGTYQFQGRQFDLARNGTLRFTGDAELNPILDVTATRKIPDTGVEARVRITGTLRSPELALSSTPPLEESDILSLIVFNRPINELGTGQRASLAATAGGIAAGFIATPLGESIGRALDLDLFEITTAGEGDTLGAGVTIGEQIGDRTFIKVRQQFGERTYTEFLLEYQIADFLRLVGSAAPETSGAANRIGQRRIERAGMDLIFSLVTVVRLFKWLLSRHSRRTAKATRNMKQKLFAFVFLVFLVFVVIGRRPRDRRRPSAAEQRHLHPRIVIVERPIERAADSFVLLSSQESYRVSPSRPFAGIDDEKRRRGTLKQNCSLCVLGVLCVRRDSAGGRATGAALVRLNSATWHPARIVIGQRPIDRAGIDLIFFFSY